jgi:hypothetical protein
MDAFVVVNREEYEKLTGYVPAKKTPYDTGPQYQLTTEDEEYIDFLSKTCLSFAKKYGPDFKQKIIILFRKMLDAPKYQSAKDQKIFHEVLIQLYKVDTL